MALRIVQRSLQNLKIRFKLRTKLRIIRNSSFKWLTITITNSILKHFRKNLKRARLLRHQSPATANGTRTSSETQLSERVVGRRAMDKPSLNPWRSDTGPIKESVMNQDWRIEGHQTASNGYHHQIWSKQSGKNPRVFIKTLVDYTKKWIETYDKKEGGNKKNKIKMRKKTMQKMVKIQTKTCVLQKQRKIRNDLEMLYKFISHLCYTSLIWLGFEC